MWPRTYESEEPPPPNGYERVRGLERPDAHRPPRVVGSDLGGGLAGGGVKELTVSDVR